MGQSVKESEIQNDTWVFTFITKLSLAAQWFRNLAAEQEVVAPGRVARLCSLGQAALFQDGFRRKEW